MAKKTNQAFDKRIRVTKKGKLVVAKAGQRHYNAKMKRSKQLNQKRDMTIKLSNKELGNYLPHS